MPSQEHFRRAQLPATGIVCLVLLLVLGSGWSAPLPAARFVRGDASSNGRIELTDGIRILEFLFLRGPPPACRDAADADDDGRLSITDAVRIFLWLFGGGAPLADPGPRQGLAVYESTDCGVDTTDDSLDCQAPATTCQGGPPGTVTFFGEPYEAAAVVWSLDNSGSMNGNRAQVLAQELTRTISELAADVEFGLVYFSSRVSAFRDSPVPVPATPATKKEAIAFVGAQSPLGDSCFGEGVVKALMIARQSARAGKAVIVVSDGGVDVCATGDLANPEQKRRILEQTLAANPDLSVKVHTILLRSDFGPFVHFMRSVAELHRGTFRQVSP